METKGGFVRLLFVLCVLLLNHSAIASGRNSKNSIQNKNGEFRIVRVKKDKMGDKEIRIPVSSMSVIDMLPSWKICNTLASTETFEVLDCIGCQITFTLTKGTTYDTGHESGHTGTHPLGRVVGRTLGVPYIIGSTPFNFVYEAPDVSTEAVLTATIVTPGGPVPHVWDSTMLSYVPDLVDQSGNSYITFDNITSHPGDGTFMSFEAGNFLTDALIEYNLRAAAYSVPTPNIVIPKSEGASLQYGGLFDINKNFNIPHCNHRDGNNIDIGMSRFASSAYKSSLLQALEEAFINNGFSFPVSYESPGDVTSNHWHAQY